MTDATTNIALPLVAAAQAQKHITVNEALLRLDALVQCNVISRTIAAQPGAPGDGDLYILPAGKTGASWATMTDLAYAHYRDGVWEQIIPREGWLAYVRDEHQLVVRTAAAWSTLTDAGVTALTLANTGLKVKDTDASHTLTIKPGSNLTANRTLTITTGDIDKTLDLSTGAALANYLADPLSAAELASVTGVFGTAAFVANSGLAHTTGAETIGGAKTFTTRIAISGDAASNNAEIAITNTGASGRTWRIGDGLAVANGNFAVYDSSAGAVRVVIETGGTIRPGSDNAVNLGAAGNRWSTVFAGTGTINTSDATEKTPLEPIPEPAKRALRRVARAIGVFQWKDALALKGPTGARLHIGVTAQAIGEAFAAEGLDPERWALFCADPVADEAGNSLGVTRLGVRYDQLFALGLAALLGETAA